MRQVPYLYIFSFFSKLFLQSGFPSLRYDAANPKQTTKKFRYFHCDYFQPVQSTKRKLSVLLKKKLIPSQHKCTSFVTSASNTVTPFVPPPTSHRQQTLLFVAAALVITRKGRFFFVFYLPHVNDEVAIRSWGHLLSSLSSCVCVCMMCVFPTRLTSSLESSCHGLEHALYRAPASLTCTHLSLLQWLTPRHQKSRPSLRVATSIAACCFISHSDQICVGSFFF